MQLVRQACRLVSHEERQAHARRCGVNTADGCGAPTRFDAAQIALRQLSAGERLEKAAMRAPRIPRETELTPTKVGLTLLGGLLLLGVAYLVGAAVMSWMLGAG